MGIPGLTGYIKCHSDRYLQPFELHDSYLVIDGNNISYQLYYNYARCNNAFGGDFDKYAVRIREFFDDILKCNITPLVLFDGATEDKKLKTVLHRFKTRLQCASSYTPAAQLNGPFLPPLCMNIFKDIIIEKNIRHVRCLFEADNIIAAIGKILNCPVLSYDSDFYIYGSLYIPFDTLTRYATKNSQSNGYIMHCKIYKIEILLDIFKGLDQSLLTLAAVLLGNDYVGKKTFHQFYEMLRIQGINFKNRIEILLHWLRKYDLNTAIGKILSRVQKAERRKILQTIETNINVYITSPPINILSFLDIPTDYVTRIKFQNAKKFKYVEDINNLADVMEISETKDLRSDEEADKEDITNIIEESNVSSVAIINNLPSWFIEAFTKTTFPPYFVNLLIRDSFITPVQIEDFKSTSAIIPSLSIIKIIVSLLTSGSNRRHNSLTCVMRGVNTRTLYCPIDQIPNIFDCNFPPLSSLNKEPLIVRKNILKHALGINDDRIIEQFPKEWILYIATIKYWIERQLSISNSYLYAILFSMLFHIIDSKVGYYRSLRKFKEAYKASANVKVLSRIEEENQQYDLTNNTITNACNEINTTDCLSAVPFFISKFNVDGKVYLNSKKYNIKVLHKFAEFQYCLIYILDLNALLGYPYQDTKVSRFLNGTLLYNLCVDFEKRYDIEKYITFVLQNSPSLLTLFRICLLKIKPLLNYKIEENSSRINVKKKKKKEARYKL